MLHEAAQYPAHITALGGASIKLAVGVSARASFAKTVIRIRIYHLVFVDGREVASPTAHIAASL